MARRFDIRRHEGERVLHGLKRRERLPELLVLEREPGRRVQTGLGDAHGLRRDADAAAVQGLHRDPEAAAQLAQHVRGRDAAFLQQDLGGR